MIYVCLHVAIFRVIAIRVADIALLPQRNGDLTKHKIAIPLNDKTIWVTLIIICLRKQPGDITHLLTLTKRIKLKVCDA